MRQKLFYTLGFLALLFASLQARADIVVGQQAPPLVVQELDGSTFDVSVLKSKVVIVHFWATWCAPCKEEMPVLDAYYKKHHGQGVDMIAVSTDTARHRDDVVTAMKAFSFPAAMITDAETNGFGAPSSIPVTYIIGGDGVIKAVLSPDQNQLTDKILDSAVQPLLTR